MSVGYENTPISMAMSVFLFLSMFRGNASNQRIFLDLARLSQGELWRLLSCHTFFSSTPQVFVSLALVYTCRQFERQMGSRKFASFLFTSYAISTLVQVAYISILASLGAYPQIATGPFFYIFSLLPLFHKHVPKIHPGRTSLMGLRLSEKTWIYLLAAQLALSEGSSSVVAALSGVAAGVLYITHNPLQSFRLPRVIENVFAPLGRFLNSFVTSARPVAPNGRRQGHAAAAAPALEPPSQQDIDMLMGLGFDRERVERALRNAGNNVQVAADRLLSGN